PYQVVDRQRAGAFQVERVAVLAAVLDHETAEQTEWHVVADRLLRQHSEEDAALSGFHQLRSQRVRQLLRTYDPALIEEDAGIQHRIRLRRRHPFGEIVLPERKR